MFQRNARVSIEICNARKILFLWVNRNFLTMDCCSEWLCWMVRRNCNDLLLSSSSRRSLCFSFEVKLKVPFNCDRWGGKIFLDFLHACTHAVTLRLESNVVSAKRREEKIQEISQRRKAQNLLWRNRFNKINIKSFEFSGTWPWTVDHRFAALYSRSRSSLHLPLFAIAVKISANDNDKHLHCLEVRGPRTLPWLLKFSLTTLRDFILQVAVMAVNTFCKAVSRSVAFHLKLFSISPETLSVWSRIC